MYTAVVCRTHDGPDSLVLEQLPSRPPASDQVRIAMQAAGLNFPDLFP
jgi:NADPH:quinone reductase-like Zn-dependent oxidoreductase